MGVLTVVPAEGIGFPALPKPGACHAPEYPSQLPRVRSAPRWDCWKRFAPGIFEMTLLGKILLFFNIIAAGAVVYFATQSWTVRQNQNYTALQYYLWIQGLPAQSDAFPTLPTVAEEINRAPIPLGTTSEPFHMGPSQPVYSIPYGVLKRHFENADKGPYSSPKPPNSRAAEVKRVRELLENNIESMSSDAERLAFLVGKYAGLRFDPGLLILLADSFEEREAYRSLIRKPSDADELSAEKLEANAKIARQALANKFDAVTNPPNAAALAEETTKLQDKFKLVAEAEAEAKTATERLKSATDSYRKLYEPLLEKSLEVNFVADADTKAAVEKARTEQDSAYEAFLKKSEAKKAAQMAWMAQQASARSAATDEPDRLRRTIQLMMVLDKGESWQRRLALVFGLKDYLVALKDRVERHTGARPYSPRLRQKMDEQTVEFNTLYERSKEVAIDRDRQLYRQKEITDAIKLQLMNSTEQLAQAKTQHEMKAADLKTIEAEVAERVATQTRIEGDLFDVQKQIGDMLRLNYELEAKLEDTERKLIGK